VGGEKERERERERKQGGRTNDKPKKKSTR